MAIRYAHRVGAVRSTMVTTCLVLLAVVTLTLHAVPSVARAQQQLQDVVYLHDGSVIRGIIVEQIPGVSILIQTVDGNRFRYSIDQIQRMTRESPVGPVRQQSVALKSPGTAGVLSVLIPGAGQAYNGYWGRGLAFFLGESALLGAVGNAAMSDECYYRDNCETAGLIFLAFLGVYVWNVLDAVSLAKSINREGLGLQPGGSDAVRLGMSYAPSFPNTVGVELRVMR
jgi:hypothetical protein